MKSDLSNISRKDFLGSLGWILSIPFLIIGGLSIRRHSQLTKNNKVIIPFDIDEGATFFNDVIVVKKEGNLHFFGSSCPHLGCKINKTENNLLVCPCHGSQFKMDGSNQKGPANQALKKLEFEIDEISGNYLVTLS